MKKTTAHGRKLRRLGITSTAHEQAVMRAVTDHQLTYTLAMRKPYSDPVNQPDADRLMVETRLDLYKLQHGQVPAADGVIFYSLCDTIGSAQMRVIEIGGPNAGPNAGPIMSQLNAAGRALHRCRLRRDSTGKWGLDGPAIHELADGIDVYEAILRESTPEQMRTAVRRYTEWRESTPATKEPA